MDGEMGQSVLLPWPPRALSPNARGHWSKRSRAAKSYRMQCFLLAKKAGLSTPAGRILLSLEFLPPNRQRRDDDNLLAAFKAGRDGLADALRIDDSVFVSQVQLSTEVYPMGAVRVTLSSYGQQGAR
ncbi:crossover junction endodeoxyribonuclease RusA [Metapseudomonas resinovorans]